MDEIRALIEQLKANEMMRIECANKIAQVDGIIEKCSKVDGLALRVGAVDACIISQEFHAFDLIMIKTAGVVFEYAKGALEKYEYIPSPFPKIKLLVHGSMELAELGQYKTILRLSEEITLARKVAEKCDLLLIDGSLVPLPGDKPSSKEMKKEYDALVKEYLQLFSESESKVIGVVKDSRSRRFMDEYSHVVSEEVAKNTNDSALLNDVLEKGEMTRAIKYSNNTQTNPVLKDFIPFSDKLRISYIKAGKDDRPVRVEFFEGNEHVRDIVYTLCAINDSYAYPSVLIEADLRALIDQKESERVLREVALTPYLKDARVLRRNSRPFRH
ncbi:MAG: DNA double-strand break repair nuclease NurA [Candidatus Micrarchaeia archaeon]